MKTIENAEITVTIRVRDRGDYTFKTFVENEERIALSATIGEITERLAVMVDSVHSKTTAELSRIDLENIRSESAEEKTELTQIIPIGNSVNMESIAKSAAGIK